MGRHVVIGAGPTGRGTAVRLAESGHEVRLVTRRGTTVAHDGIDAVAADASHAERMVEVTIGADAVYNCVNPPYAAWATTWPPIAAALLAAAEANDAVLVTMSNLYAYGPGSAQPMTEELPLAAIGTKGRVRARMWQDALAAHEAGRVRVTEARASDFIGPGVVDAAMGERVVPMVLAGKRVRTIGDPDAAHSWTSTDDVARTLAVLGTDERALGRPWHVPTAPACSVRELVGVLADAAGVPAPPVSGVPRGVLVALGWFSPLMKELRETAYQFEHPFVIDASDAEAVFGLRATPLAETAATTVAWWRDRLAGPPEVDTPTT
ncbi:MAG: NAD-dependent epimerase/dehydratase family protein [Acidimicrobiales bacterium]|jgi:nucleoside-diphosphate-sugar epimerase|nr:NAD-dependent epimerase/dehydratase family protein [Acidimicrobiales bacterium]